MKKQKNKSYLLLPVVVMATLVLSGCGESVSQKASEKAAEKMIEAGAGGKADVDIDGENIKIETGEGKMESGEDVKLPDNFPSDFYVIEGKIKSTISDQANEGQTISVETDKSPAEVSKIYQEKLKDAGWKIAATMDLGETITLAAEKNDKSASVMASQTDGITTAIITIGKK